MNAETGMGGSTACGTQRWYRLEGRLYRSYRDSSRIESGRDLGRKWMISGAKFDGFCGWKVEKLGEMLDPLETKQIHGSKSTKHHQNQQITKKSDFRTKSSKRRLEKEGWGSKFMINLALIQDDVG